jgi:AcrR family transcriptional regulator
MLTLSTPRGKPLHVSRARSAYHHGELRQTVLETAAALIEERGLEAFTLREVARLAGVSHNAPYRHFADSEAVFSALAVEGFSELAARLEPLAQRARNPRSALIRCAEVYVGFGRERPGRYRLMFGRRERDGNPELRVSTERAIAPIVTLVRAGQHQRSITAANTADLARICWSLVHGLTTLALDRQLPMRSERQFRSLIRLGAATLFDGLESK